MLRLSAPPSAHHRVMVAAPLTHGVRDLRRPHLLRSRVVNRSSERPPQNTSDEQASTSGSDERSPEQQLLDGVPDSLQISKQVIEELKFKVCNRWELCCRIPEVFSFDTFWVTSVENYESDGVVFKGNMRGKDTEVAYNKMQQRMKEQLGDDYTLFLLEDREGKPTAVVLPRANANEGRISGTTEVWLAVLFAALTAITTANANGVPLLQFLIDPFRTEISTQDVTDAILPALAFWFCLGAHEWGHRTAAARRNMELYLPFVVPAGFGFLGSFGAITRIKGFAPSRAALLDFAATGPLVGSAAATALVFVGFVLSALGVTDVTIDSLSFQDSFIMAVAAQAFLGEQLMQPEVPINSLLVAGWAALIVNSLNCIPAGELDGARIALAIWGRRTYNVLGIASTAVLAVTSLASSLSFYWIGLLLFLQRGPLLPCKEELGEPKDENAINAGLLMLLLPLLVLAPFPTGLLVSLSDLGSTDILDTL